ncbi:MAG TPA: hypothetical protein VFA87_04905 [Rhizomicrobium sp.]|nr:hypothetical protein [Rhizomicrobium sp.]
MFTRRGLSGWAAGIAALAGGPAAAASGGAGTIAELQTRLAKLPARRDFKTVPLVLDATDLWDDAAIREVAAYRGNPRQVWDNKDLTSGWAGFMRNALNGQTLSFKNKDFLTVSMTRGDAQLALFDQASWDKYGLAKLTNGKFASNSFIVAGAGDAQDPSIPTLMKRGVVFMACHNAIWAAAGRVIAGGAKGAQEEVAADLTNHLLPGVILTPGALATLPVLQGAGFHYVT